MICRTLRALHTLHRVAINTDTTAQITQSLTDAFKCIGATTYACVPTHAAIKGHLDRCFPSPQAPQTSPPSPPTTPSRCNSCSKSRCPRPPRHPSPPSSPPTSPLPSARTPPRSHHPPSSRSTPPPRSRPATTPSCARSTRRCPHPPASPSSARPTSSTPSASFARPTQPASPALPPRSSLMHRDSSPCHCRCSSSSCATRRSRWGCHLGGKHVHLCPPCQVDSEVQAFRAVASWVAADPAHRLTILRPLLGTSLTAPLML